MEKEYNEFIFSCEGFCKYEGSVKISGYEDQNPTYRCTKGVDCCAIVGLYSAIMLTYSHLKSK